MTQTVLIFQKSLIYAREAAAFIALAGIGFDDTGTDESFVDHGQHAGAVFKGAPAGATHAFGEFANDDAEDGDGEDDQAAEFPVNRHRQDKTKQRFHRLLYRFPEGHAESVGEGAGVLSEAAHHVTGAATSEERDGQLHDLVVHFAADVHDHLIGDDHAEVLLVIAKDGTDEAKNDEENNGVDESLEGVLREKVDNCDGGNHVEGNCGGLDHDGFAGRALHIGELKRHVFTGGGGCEDTHHIEPFIRMAFEETTCFLIRSGLGRGHDGGDAGDQFVIGIFPVLGTDLQLGKRVAIGTGDHELGAMKALGLIEIPKFDMEALFSGGAVDPSMNVFLRDENLHHRQKNRDAGGIGQADAQGTEHADNDRPLIRKNPPQYPPPRFHKPSRLDQIGKPES